MTLDLKQNFSGEVSTDENTLVAYSHDASIFEIKPEAVVFPKNVGEIKQLVKYVSAQKVVDSTISLTARSGGTDMAGGSINESILVDFTKYFNHILEVKKVIPFTNAKGKQIIGEATVGPGVYYRDFEPKTLEIGAFMPTFPASREICTVGGMAANNSGGEMSLGYGQTKDYISELKVVLSDGEEHAFGELDEKQLHEKMKLPNFEGDIYRRMFELLDVNFDFIQSKKPTTSKNSAGYFLWDVWNKKTFNLCKLLSGSQGTLGLTTQIKFNLVPVREPSHLLVIFLKDLVKLGEIVETVMKYSPDTFESYDDNTLKLAIKFLPQMISSMKGGIFKLGWQFLPEMGMAITGGLPKMVLIAEFSGHSEAEILAKISPIARELKNKFKVKTHTTQTSLEAQKYWTIRRESFNLLRKHVHGISTAPFIDDIIVHPNQLPEFLPRLNEILKKYPQMFYTIAGHAGDANFHIIPLLDLKLEKNHRAIAELSDKVYDLVLEYKGSITAEHNDGLIRTPYLEKMYGPEMCALFEKTKDIFDPQNIFNPGKKVRGSLQYSLSHIKKG